MGTQTHILVSYFINFNWVYRPMADYVTRNCAGYFMHLYSCLIGSHIIITTSEVPCELDRTLLRKVKGGIILFRYLKKVPCEFAVINHQFIAFFPFSFALRLMFSIAIFS
jgi:hypothetical protein